MPGTLLEVCAGDMASVLAAAEGGAKRIELCAALDCGGLTPSAALIAQALRQTDLRVHVLIRPREGDFVYSEAETAVMADDIRMARLLGVHGVVIGALTPEGEIDVECCQRLIEAAGPDMDITFHRAFDRCRQPLYALRQIWKLGCRRLLTSGQAPTAFGGRALIAELVASRYPGLTIMAGGGVTPDNARAIVEATGISEIHASCRAAVEGSKASQPVVKMGASDGAKPRMATSARMVATLLETLS